MAETIIEVTGQVKLSYNENSKEFKDSLESYADVIERVADKNKMLKHVAFYITRFGTDGMVEGVGYVGVNGRKPEDEPYSGIMVASGYDDFDFDVF